MSNELHITSLQEHDLHRAAEIFNEAFERKLRLLRPSKTKGIELIEKIIVRNNAISAIDQNKCVGIAGLQYAKESFIKPNLLVFIRTIGLFRGLLGFIAFRMMIETIPNGELRIESLAVLSAYRGRGIGSLLLEEVTKIAKRDGYKTLSLEVVDTNPDARRLYKRNGFIEVKTMHYPYLKGVAGFSAVTLMKKEIV